MSSTLLVPLHIFFQVQLRAAGFLKNTKLSLRCHSHHSSPPPQATYLIHLSCTGGTSPGLKCTFQNSALFPHTKPHLLPALPLSHLIPAPHPTHTSSCFSTPHSRRAPQHTSSLPLSLTLHVILGLLPHSHLILTFLLLKQNRPLYSALTTDHRYTNTAI